MKKLSLRKLAVLALPVMVIAGLGSPATAGTIAWIGWSGVSCTNCAVETWIGSTGSVSAVYTGEIYNFSVGYPSWTPTGTFSGGTISNAPLPSDGMIGLLGGTPNSVNTITFSAPVVDPVMAIWSLGQNNTQASFDFSALEPFSIQSGGPSSEYGGLSISASGTSVLGLEGNGTIQFSGTYSSITWTNNAFENWYGFTVGTPVPAPSSLAIIGLALLSLFGFGLMRRRAERE